MTNRASYLKFGLVTQLHMFSMPINVKGLGRLLVCMGTEGRGQAWVLDRSPCEYKKTEDTKLHILLNASIAGRYQSNIEFCYPGDLDVHKLLSKSHKIMMKIWI